MFLYQCKHEQKDRGIVSFISLSNSGTLEMLGNSTIGKRNGSIEKYLDPYVYTEDLQMFKFVL